MLTLSEEQKFHLIFAQGSESSWEWKYQRDVWNFRSRERKYVGTKVPGKFHLIFARGSESTWERKFLLPLEDG